MKSLELWFLRTTAIVCLLLKRDAQAISHWYRMLALNPGDTPENAKIVASIAHSQAALGRPSEAIALLYRSLEMDSDQPANWFNLGYLLQQEGADEDAAMALLRATRLDPKLDRAWYGLALSLIKLGRVEDAVDALKRNTELQPLSPYGWYQLAHAHLRLGQRDEAETVIRRIAKFEPKVAQQLERETGIASGVNLPF